MIQTSSRPHDHAELIEASWNRCRSFGLDHASEPSLERLSRQAFDLLQEQHRFLVDTTGNEVLPYYENILSNSQCLILLTDSHGCLLNSWGDRRFLDSRRKVFFDKGVDWKEEINGTNAVGTALASGQAVQVLRDEHFLKANRFMIGSAAPIYSANRDLLGVLDVSSDAYLPQAHTLGMVKLMSQAVENRLIINTFSDHHYLLNFNTNLENIDSQWAGLIVFDDQGVIISANRRAELMLGCDLAMVPVTQVFDCRLLALKSHPERMPLALRTMSRYQMHGVLRRPGKPVVKAVDFRAGSAPDSVPIHSPEPGGISLDQLGFGDQRVARCVEQARRIVEKDIPILVHGETGVGKEIFVKALHAYSSRRSRPLIAVNCAAIPSELVESELFGYEKGAFTGASSKGSPGLIRQAHGGTLFLDEIGDMPLNAQTRLLRVLQERRVMPLGSVESYPLDVRLISATNQLLRDNVEQGLFRQDLYYRVSGLNLHLPPLRERSDRRELFQEIHRRHRLDSQPADLSEEILGLFEQHPWPGNLRQLVSVVRIALAMADDEPLQPWHLPDDFFLDLERPLEQPGVSAANEPFGAEAVTEEVAVGEEMAGDRTDVETLRVYNQHEGNISRTARSLGVSRNTLYKRLRDLGLR
jgi:transcriptional regulator of acetoin/glycerol metabolism